MKVREHILNILAVQWQTCLSIFDVSYFYVSFDHMSCCLHCVWISLWMDQQKLPKDRLKKVWFHRLTSKLNWVLGSYVRWYFGHTCFFRDAQMLFTGWHLMSVNQIDIARQNIAMIYCINVFYPTPSNTFHLVLKSLITDWNPFLLGIVQRHNVFMHMITAFVT